MELSFGACHLVQVGTLRRLAEPALSFEKTEANEKRGNKETLVFVIVVHGA